MKKLLTLMALLCLFTLCGCEKTYYITNYVEEKDEAGKEDEGKEESGKDDSGKDDGDNNEDGDDTGGDSPDDVTGLTVKEAMKALDGETVTVKGYIVGACSRAMKNADFEKPFTGRTAIVLRSRPVADGEVLSGEDDDLMPVCINDYKESSTALNLEDNPELWNTRIVITGIRTKYLARPGIKYVTKWAFW